MKYCTRCLYPENHPLGLVLDYEGVCSGCRVHEEKDELDWAMRYALLTKIAVSYRSKSKFNYDCIVPVSGARDSYFILKTVKHDLKLNPLLVSYNKHYNTEMGIRNLARLRTLFDCDYIQQVTKPQLIKRINRETLDKIGSMYWHVLAGQTVFPVQVAVRLKIPLIIWGAHQGCDQVGMFSHTDEVEMTRKYRKDHDLMGWEAEDLVGGCEKLSEVDLYNYIYPTDSEISQTGVRGIYLSNYIRWDSKSQHERMLDLFGYETSNQQRTFDTYNDVDCIHYSGLHDYIKYLKWGYSKVTDHASREIRLGNMSRVKGIKLVEKYENIEPKDISLFLNFCGISETELFDCINRHRDQNIWHRDGSGGWQILDSITNYKLSKNIGVLSEKNDSCSGFRVTSTEGGNDSNKYTLLHRGWVDNN
jgi:N-acetyl sugar amidotransferase